jgi:hypothetical protein
MKYIIIILLVCFGFIAKAQVPTGFPSQRWAGYIEPTYVVPDSGTIISKRDTNFIPRFVGTTVTWQRPGIDTTFWFWNGRNWGRVSAAALDTTSLSNRINQKLNITDTVGKWLSQASRLVDTLYRVNDSTVGFTIKHTPYTFQILGRTPSSGTGTVTSVGLSMPAAFSVSGSPVTTSGTLNVSGAGTSLQYIRGDGTLATMDTTAIPNFFIKARSLLSGTSPITYNSTTGAIGILNANTSGTKGAATFTNSDFSDNGSGTISLANIVGAGSCINCQFNVDAKGRITSYANGTVPLVVNASGAGDTLVTTNDTIKRLNAGYGILHSVTQSSITQSVDTTLISPIISANNGLTKIGNTIQLGGALTKNDTLDAGSSYSLQLLASGTNAPLKITHSGSGNGAFINTFPGTGIGLNVQSNNANAIQTFAFGTGYGAALQSVGNIGAYISTTSGVSGAAVEANPSSTNTSQTILQLKRYTSGTSANNIAGRIEFITEPSSGTVDVTSGYIESGWEDATFATRKSWMAMYTTLNGSTSKVLNMGSSGQMTLPLYPSLTAQTDSATYKPMGIDGSGNVARMANWFGAGGSGTATLNYKNVGFGGIGNTLSPGEAAFQYDSITNKLRVDSIDMVQSRMDSAFMIRLSPYVSSDTMVANGNSITYGLNASPITDSAYAYIIASKLAQTITNIGVSSTGMVSIANRNLINVNPGNHVMETVMGGLNDVRANGPARKTLNKVINGYKSIFANQYMKAYTNAGTGGVNVTRYGSWTNSWNAQAEGGKTTVGAYTSTTNDSITYTFTDSTVIVGLMGGDGSVASLIGTDIDVYIDGVFNSTINTNNQTDGVTEGGGFPTNRCAMAFYFGSLTNAAHKIKLVKKSTGGGGYMICDYFGHFRRSDSANLMLWFEAPYLKGIGYAGGLASNSVIDTLNSKIDSLITTSFIKWYPTYVVKTNNCYDTTSGTSTDGIHPNNTGHLQIANCGLNRINSIAGGAFTTGKFYYTDQFHGVVEGQDDIFLMLSKGDKRYIQNQTTTAQAANYNINGSGTATKFITTAGVFGVMTNPTTDRQIQGISVGTVSGLAVINFRNNGAATDNKTYDWFAGSRQLNHRILSDDLTTAIDYLQIIRTNGAMGVDSIKFPVGKLYVENVPVTSNVDSVLTWDRTSGEIRYAKINGTTGITSINSQTGPSITLAGSNGLTATTTSNTVTYTLGGTLSGFTQIAGGSNSLLLGTSGSHLSGLTVYGDVINLLGNTRYGTEDYGTDADHTVSSSVTFEELHDVPLTANRTLTLPSAVQQGQILTIVTRYSTGTNHFVLSSAIVDNSTGATFTQLDWGKRYDFYVDSAVGWILISKY